MKPDYDNPHISCNRDLKTAKDIFELSKQKHAKIQKSLDDLLPEGWTLVYMDSFLNTIICTNDGQNVTEPNYALTRFIQASLKKVAPDVV